jgi:hypothetical protein
MKIIVAFSVTLLHAFATPCDDGMHEVSKLTPDQMESTWPEPIFAPKEHILAKAQTATPTLNPISDPITNTQPVPVPVPAESQLLTPTSAISASNGTSLSDSAKSANLSIPDPQAVLPASSQSKVTNLDIIVVVPTVRRYQRGGSPSPERY